MTTHSVRAYVTGIQQKLELDGHTLTKFQVR